MEDTNTNKIKVKDIFAKYIAQRKALTAKHLEKVAVRKAAVKDLVDFNKNVWKPQLKMLKTDPKKNADALKALRLEHSKKVAAYKTADAALLDFNKTTWKTGIKELETKFNSDRKALKEAKSANTNAIKTDAMPVVEDIAK